MAKIAVAPLVGAWIEIRRSSTTYELGEVAPLVGAWIEIRVLMIKAMNMLSLPSWERGLKSQWELMDAELVEVAPLVGAWIEIVTLFATCSLPWSLPSWERGLKLLKDAEKRRQE